MTLQEIISSYINIDINDTKHNFPHKFKRKTEEQKKLHVKLF